MERAPLRTVEPDLAPQQVSARLFAGELLVFRHLDSTRAIVQRAQDILRRTFDTDHYLRAEFSLGAAAFRARATWARRRIARDPVIEQHWRQTLASVGYPLARLQRDRVRLRVVPAHADNCARALQPLPAHRDTWGSAIMAQVNWWLPLHELAPTRTMLVWPQCFTRPISNDSGEWDYERLRSGADANYPLLPSATVEPDEPGLPVMLAPGELLAFSAAHLHAGVSDAAGLTRFSLDTRSVWTDDVAAGRGAPNVDGHQTRRRWEWFRDRTASPRADASQSALDRPVAALHSDPGRERMRRRRSELQR